MPIPQPACGASSRVQSLAMHRTIAIICAEHRSLREVLQKMQQTVHGMFGRPVSLECINLRLMLRYISTFPDAVHHPKEDLYLFAKLRQRTGDLDVVMAELGRHHDGSKDWLDTLGHTLTRFEQGFPPALDEFLDVLDAYCDVQHRHMQLEESVILPAAAEHLTVEDWEEIAAAFRSNGDSRFDAAEEKRCSSLYARISRM